MDKTIDFEKLRSILRDLIETSPDIISVIKGIQIRLQQFESTHTQLPELTDLLKVSEYDFIEDSHLEAIVERYISTKPNGMHLLEFASFQPFTDLFMKLIKRCPFCDPKRRPIFKEAFDLYKNQFFAGSICLLYGQIEGLITDLLLYEKQMYRRRGYLYSRSLGTKPRKIVGLKLKLEVADNHPKTRWITQLGAYGEFKTVNGNQRLTLSRNAVLHGDELNNLNQEHAFILIMWVYYLFVQADEIYHARH